MAEGQGNYWIATKQAHLTRRRLIALSAAGSAALAGGPLLACSSHAKQSSGAGSSSSQSTQSSAGTPQPGGLFTVAFTLNGLLDTHKSSNDHTVIAPVLSRLFRFKTGPDPKEGTNHDLENDLAVSIESPDAITWTAKLRPDAKWHNIAPVNGRLVEAEDVKATFTRALDPSIGNPNRGTIGMIDPNQIQTPDKQTVVFKLTYPYSPFSKLMASPATSWIIPREALAGAYDLSKTLIGSGPFILDSVQPDVAYNYKKNPDWFDKPKPYVDGVKIAIIPDTHTQEAQFAAGNLDVLSAPIIDLDAIKQQNPKAQIIQTQSATPSPLYPQEGDSTGPFYDVRVRRAVSMLIDRDALNKALLNSMGIRVAFVPTYLGKWALLTTDLPKETQAWYSYDPQQAKQLLAAAGQSNLTIRLGYVVAGPFSTAAYTNLAETLNGMMNQGGIKCSLFTQDYNTQYIGGGHGSRQGFFDRDSMILAGVGSVTDADSAIFDNFSSKSTSNGDHLSDATLDAMIDKERQLVNEDERLKACLDIERYVADKVYVIPTLGTNGWLFLNPRVQNYQYSASQGTGTETYAKVWLSK
jgi:peptide/nickel transport system substrate-binding protein